MTGDDGARLALDALAQSNPAAGPHRLTHLYLVDPEDLPRFAELNVVADLQLAPSALDPDYVAYISGFIGHRTDQILPVRALLDAGALVTMSSDWDADELNPLVKIAAVIGRIRNGLPDVVTAIETMTINPAILLQHEDRTGSIEVGKYADLVFLSENILSMSLPRIANTQIDGTLLQGEPVYDPRGLFTDR